MWFYREPGHPSTPPLKLSCESEESSLEYMKMLNYSFKKWEESHQLSKWMNKTINQFLFQMTSF